MDPRPLIRDYLQRNGISHEALASRVGIHRVSVTRYLNEGTDLAAETVLAMLDEAGYELRQKAHRSRHAQQTGGSGMKAELERQTTSTWRDGLPLKKVAEWERWATDFVRRCPEVSWLSPDDLCAMWRAGGQGFNEKKLLRRAVGRWREGLSVEKIAEWESWAVQFIESHREAEAFSPDHLCARWRGGGSGFNERRLLKWLRDASVSEST